MYEQFIKNIHGINVNGENIPLLKDLNDAPRWNVPANSSAISRIEYDVDLNKMERKMAPADASIIRSGFVGMLNYSILGWINGTENEEVECRVQTFPSWPIFSSNIPTASPEKGTLHFKQRIIGCWQMDNCISDQDFG